MTDAGRVAFPSVDEAAALARPSRVIERSAAWALAGALVLLIVAAARLPVRSLFRRPATPFDRTQDPGAGPTLALLTRASAFIPAGAKVAVRSVSGRADESAFCSLLAKSLLPSAKIVSPETSLVGSDRPDFVILAGLDAPDQVPGRLLLRTAVGAVWDVRP
jgi:hypothetical protein